MGPKTFLAALMCLIIVALMCSPILSRMARFYYGRFSNSQNSIYRDRAHPIAFIQANFKSYRQGLQDILIVSTIKTSYLIEGGITLISVIPPSFVWYFKEMPTAEEEALIVPTISS